MTRSAGPGQTARPLRFRAFIRAPLALGASAALALAPSISSAHDAHRVHTFVLGRSPALAACAGLDSSNGNRASVRFPLNGELAFRTRLPGGIGQAPASDEHGNLIIAHGEPRLTKLDSKGRTLWSQRLPSEASCAPVLTSSGSIVILTRDAEALLFSGAGELQKRRLLPLSDAKRRISAIPTASGGVLLSWGRDLIQLDGEVQLVRQLRASGLVSSVAESGPDLVVITESGNVELARTSGAFELVGSFGGNVPDGAAVQGGKVFALVDAHKWLALDLSSGAVHTLAMESNSTLSGPVALLQGGAAALVVDGGFVSIRSSSGGETVRVSLSPTALSFDAAQRGLSAALLISDQAAGVAAVRSGNDALVLAADGGALRVEGTSCLDPFRPTPTRSGLVFTCRSGQIFGWGNRASSDRDPRTAPSPRDP